MNSRRRTKQEIERDKINAEFLRQTFDARPFPEAIFIGEDAVIGPFCVHCGNPLHMHGPDRRCPNRHLHPLFPPPNLPYAESRS